MAVFSTSDSFTRPANTTAYADEDLVANNTTANSVVPMRFGTPVNGLVFRARLMKSGATATNANFTLYLYNTAPTVTNGDNGAFVPIEASLMGTIDLDMTGSLSSDDASVVSTLSTPIFCTGNLWGLLKAQAAYTPASAEVFTVTLYGEV